MFNDDDLILQLEGTILAPTSAKSFGSGLLQWLEFTKLNGIVIQGNGIINGRGQQWWTYSDPEDEYDDDMVKAGCQVFIIYKLLKRKVVMLISYIDFPAVRRGARENATD